MRTPEKNFLTNLSKRGGINGYVALVMLGAVEKKQKELLKKFDIETIRAILNERRKYKYGEIFKNKDKASVS